MDETGRAAALRVNLQNTMSTSERGPYPAAESHNVSALETLGMLRDMQGDHAAAFKAYKKSAMLGSSFGQFKLGEIFYRGLGNQVGAQSTA